MTKKVLKLLMVTVIIFIGIIAYFYFNYAVVFQPSIKAFQPENGKDESQILSAIQVNEDIQELISVVEDTHPNFLKTVSDKYYSAKQDLLGYWGNSMTVGKLQYEISKIFIFS